MFYLSPTLSELPDCPYHFNPGSFIDLLGTSVLLLQIHDLAGEEGGEILVFNSIALSSE